MIKSLDRLAELLRDMRQRTELIRGRRVEGLAVVIQEDGSGAITADLDGGSNRDTAEQSRVFADAPFRGPEELLRLLRGRDEPRWAYYDETEQWE